MIKPNEEVCGYCGKTISRRAHANILDDQVLCTPCLKLLTSRTSPIRPATEKQLAFLRILGFGDVDAFTFNQASQTLDRAQQVRYFAFAVARQEWGKDLYKFDLGPLIQATFQDPVMLEEIYQTMQKIDEAKYTRQHEYQERHYKDRDYDCPSLADCAPDLEKGLNYHKVRDGLQALFGTSILKPPCLWREIVSIFFPLRRR